ncbi:MAG TPA: ABC transporter permease [Steroidobacteraceae bacterium]|nr:ABC transporter permease [Steroidobacteraceae bacterium]
MSVSMRRIGLVAARDYKATITSRGFLIGLLIMPAMVVIFAVLMPKILNSRSPQVAGEVMVIDPTGKVGAELTQTVAPASIELRRSMATGQNPAAPPGQTQPTPAAAPAVGPPIPRLSLVTLPADTDVSDHKSWLIQPRNATPQHLAIVVVRPDAVVPRPQATAFGNFDLYTSVRIDDNTETTLRDSVRAALIAARLRNAGQDPDAIARDQQVTQPESVVMSATGQRSGSRLFARILPFACGVLIFMGVMMGGSGLMTSTVEEKSNRVIEVLLAAVSPLELMYGKLLGQLGLGLTLMGVYLVLSVYTLGQYSLAVLLDPMLIVYLLAFYIVTYMVFGSLMLTIGAAVNQMAEAQSFMGPLVILLVVGYSMTGIIGQAPNSTFSVAMSFIPPINTFAMMGRIASSAPPPAWQVWATLGVSCVAVAAVVWFAAKVFKIGLLMHGKPPSIATLIQWARMA